MAHTFRVVDVATSMTAASRAVDAALAACTHKVTVTLAAGIFPNSNACTMARAHEGTGLHFARHPSESWSTLALLSPRATAGTVSTISTAVIRAVVQAAVSTVIR